MTRLRTSPTNNDYFKNYTFLSGWRDYNTPHDIFFEFQYRNGDLHIINDSCDKRLVKIDEYGNYDLKLDGYSRPFLRINNNKVTISTPYGTYPFFTWETSNGYVVSNSLNNFAKYRQDPPINREYMALRTLGEVPGLHLPFMDTRYLFPFFEYTVSRKGIIPQSCLLLKNTSEQSSMGRAFEQADSLYKHLGHLYPALFASLTGGYDSRFYAAMMRRHMPKDSLYFFYIGDFEKHIASLVAKQIDAHFHVFNVETFIDAIRQQPLEKFYDSNQLFHHSSGLWREEGLYLFSANALVCKNIIGHIPDNAGFYGLGLETTSKGKGYDDGTNAVTLFDTMYIKRHPALKNIRNEITFQHVEIPVLEDLYKREIEIIRQAPRHDIVTDLLITYLGVFPKMVLRMGVYAQSGRTYYPLIDERFLQEYLFVPQKQKADMGFYRYAFHAVNPTLAALPHQSMYANQRKIDMITAGFTLHKIMTKLRLGFGLSKKYKGPKRSWKNELTRIDLEEIARGGMERFFPELSSENIRLFYPYEIYLMEKYMRYIQIISPK